MGSEPYSIVEARIAPYSDLSTLTVGTWVVVTKPRTLSYAPTVEEITNQYAGGRQTYYDDRGGTLTLEQAGVSLALAAAVTGRTVTIAGAGGTLVTTLDLPVGLGAPPYVAVELRMVTGDGGDQVERYDKCRFQPRIPGGGTINEWRNTSYTGAVEGGQNIQQRATAAALA